MQAVQSTPPAVNPQPHVARCSVSTPPAVNLTARAGECQKITMEVVKMKNAVLASASDYVETVPARSAWVAGVKVYADCLLRELDEAISDGWYKPEILNDRKETEAALLNGAHDWKAYSWGGCALVYDRQIAEILCTPSELKRTRNGERRPNAREEWLDVQARALCQAALLVQRAIYEAKKAETEATLRG